jgi:hypothetical protein
MTVMPTYTTVLTLDDLAGLSMDALSRLYADGGRPNSLAALNGSARGRLLTMAALERTPLSGVLRYLAASRFFPWQGKHFDTRARKSGHGDNRIRLPFYRGHWFGFRTKIGRSLLDGQECVLLDYDSASNPRPLRRIRDELREVMPGLYLGPALWQQHKEAPVLLLWFALDTRRTAI